MADYKKVVSILQDAKDRLASELTEPQDQNHKIRLQHALDREINHISLVTGTGVVVDAAPRTKLGPATSIAGEKIERPKLVVARDLEPKDEKLELLRKQVNETYGIFLTTENKELLKHVVLKGVAKKAGLNVKDLPAKLNTKAIEEIKAAIKKENDALNARITEAEKNVGDAKALQIEAEEAYNQAVKDGKPEADLTTLKAAADKAAETQTEAQSILEELLKRKG